MSKSDPIRVMIVDDHALVRSGLGAFLEVYEDLELAGEAEDGAKAVELCGQLQPDVVLMDIRMPGVDGMDLLPQLVRHLPGTTVIMMSAYGTIDMAVEAMKLGAYDFLMKPCDIEELVRKVEAATKKKREHEEKIEEAKKQETLAKYGPFYYT